MLDKNINVRRDTGIVNISKWEKMTNKVGIIWTIVQRVFQPCLILIGLQISGVVWWRGTDFYQISHVSRDSRHAVLFDNR